jgi:hypothetical protein
VETIQREMGSTTNNGDNSNISRTLLHEADELAKNRKWTRDFALYVMFCRAMAAGDKIRAESCMKLLEQEFMNSLQTDDEDDPIFLKDKNRD